MRKAHTRDAQIGGWIGSGHAAAPGAADWLRLAASPTFAIMALLTSASGGAADMMMRSAAHGVSPLSGMAPMYALMSAFHSAPWLRLISGLRSRGRLASFTRLRQWR